MLCCVLVVGFCVYGSFDVTAAVSMWLFDGLRCVIAAHTSISGGMP